MKASEAFSRLRRVFLDSAPVIYHVQANPVYSGRTALIFQRIDSGEVDAALHKPEPVVPPQGHSGGSGKRKRMFRSEEVLTSRLKSERSPFFKTNGAAGRFLPPPD